MPDYLFVALNFELFINRGEYMSSENAITSQQSTSSKRSRGLYTSMNLKRYHRHLASVVHVEENQPNCSESIASIL